jgi:hypothetical protein
MEIKKVTIKDEIQTIEAALSQMKDTYLAIKEIMTRDNNPRIDKIEEGFAIVLGEAYIMWQQKSTEWSKNRFNKGGEEDNGQDEK